MNPHFVAASMRRQGLEQPATDLSHPTGDALQRIAANDKLRITRAFTEARDAVSGSIIERDEDGRAIGFRIAPSAKLDPRARMAREDNILQSLNPKPSPPREPYSQP